MPLTHWRVLRTLHNPRHVGVFAYGRRREAATLSQATTGIMVAAADVNTLWACSPAGFPV